MQWITDLAAAYPNNAEVISAGKSVEGRDIKGIHIWGSGGKGSKPAVVIHGNVHAREWITSMTTEYVVCSYNQCKIYMLILDSQVLCMATAYQIRLRREHQVACR